MNYWVSCSRWTVKAETDERDIIIRVPWMLRKFVGQHINNLLRWAVRQGGFQFVKWED